MASAAHSHTWAKRQWDMIPEETIDGVSTREVLLVSRTVADKLSTFRDAAGGTAVVLQHLARPQFADQPDLLHAAVLLGNANGEVVCRIARLADIRRAKALVSTELRSREIGGDMNKLLAAAVGAVAAMQARNGHTYPAPLQP